MVLCKQGSNGRIMRRQLKRYNAEATEEDTNEVDSDEFIKELKRLQRLNYDKVFLEAGFTEKEIISEGLYNACATRVCLALHKAGHKINTNKSGYYKNGKRIITSVVGLSDYLTESFGKPLTIGFVESLPKNIGAKQGVVLFIHNEGDGHATGFESGAKNVTDSTLPNTEGVAVGSNRTEFWEL